jgi:hypothetical protein
MWGHLTYFFWEPFVKDYKKRCYIYSSVFILRFQVTIRNIDGYYADDDRILNLSATSCGESPIVKEKVCFIFAC